MGARIHDGVRDRGRIDREGPDPAPGVHGRESLLQRAPPGLAILDERRRRLAHDAGQDGPLDVPELLLDLLQLLFQAASGRALRDPERVQVTVHGRDQGSARPRESRASPGSPRAAAARPWPP